MEMLIYLPVFMHEQTVLRMSLHELELKEVTIGGQEFEPKGRIMQWNKNTDYGNA
jgi:hypothetical protein